MSQLEDFALEIGEALGRGVARGLNQALAGGVSPGSPASVQRAARPPSGERRGPATPRRAGIQGEAPQIGTVVEYRQGRGAFEARVVGFDSAAGTLELERAVDGKHVTRPIAKVTKVGRR